MYVGVCSLSFDVHGKRIEERGRKEETEGAEERGRKKRHVEYRIRQSGERETERERAAQMNV